MPTPLPVLEAFVVRSVPQQRHESIAERSTRFRGAPPSGLLLRRPKNAPLDV